MSAKADVVANKEVTLRAKDDSTITAVVPAVAISVSIGIGFSIGVSLTDNLISNRIEAIIDDATVRSVSSNVIVDAASIGKIEATATLSLFHCLLEHQAQAEELALKLLVARRLISAQRGRAGRRHSAT